MATSLGKRTTNSQMQTKMATACPRIDGSNGGRNSVKAHVAGGRPWMVVAPVSGPT